MKDFIKDGIKNRICYVCRKELELNELNFYRNKTKEAGFELCCKNCSKHRLSKYKSKKKTDVEKNEYNNYRNKWRLEQFEKGKCRVCNNDRLPIQNNVRNTISKT